MSAPHRTCDNCDEGSPWDGLPYPSCPCDSCDSCVKRRHLTEYGFDEIRRWFDEISARGETVSDLNVDRNL